MTARVVLAIAAALLAACTSARVDLSAGTSPSAVEVGTGEHLARLRAIQPSTDAKQTEQYNRDLQAAWQYFAEHPESAAMLRNALSAEIAKPAGRSDFILLDVGFYLHQRGEAADRALAREALFALDPTSAVVRTNVLELFQFTQAVGADRDKRVLDFIDRAFLGQAVSVRIPAADLLLDPAATCAYLYGAYGIDAEPHLAAKLSAAQTNPLLVDDVLRVLTWIGSPASNAAVKDMLPEAQMDGEMFMRAATFLMAAGGPDGRAILLEFKATEPPSAAFLRQVRPRIERTSFGTLRTDLVSNEQSKAALDSAAKGNELVGSLLNERIRIFRAPPTRDALKEVVRINAVINAIRYRES